MDAVVVHLLAVKGLVDAARELLRRAMLMADATVFEAVAEAFKAADEASWRLQRLLDELSGHHETVRQIVREALMG